MPLPRRKAVCRPLARQGAESGHNLVYPRRTLSRTLVRALGRGLLPLLFQVDVEGKENFPEGGPLLVVGNHRAVMEAVLIAVYTPWQIEPLGASDVPHERFVQLALDTYGYIPVNRGHFDRRALLQALDVLDQGGIVAIFPEGGIWDAGRMRAQTGVAWLSYRANAPVLPIGFGGTLGALGDALRLKRPRLTMRVGDVMDAASLPEDQSRKGYLQAYAERTVDAIQALVPPEDRAQSPEVQDERFELRVAVWEDGGVPASCPRELSIDHREALAELLHSAPILKIFTSNLDLPTRPLQHLDRCPRPGEIAKAAASVLSYLDEDNPYLLTYRVGPGRAEAMERGLEELLELAHWARDTGLSIELTPVRRYILAETGEEITETQQGTFKGWM